MTQFSSFLEMATTRRQSNAEREKWRTKCCEALCSHINSRLSLSIEPSQVRLLPVREDPYRWSIVPGKEYLFEKNLSDQSTKIYKDLYQGINKDFKATKPPPSLLDKLPQRDNASTSHQTTIRVTSQINELQVQKDYALQRIKLLESQLQEELKRRVGLEEKLQVAHERQQCLMRELQKAERRETYFRNAALDYSQEIAKVAPALRKLTEKTYFTDDGFI
ncbi:uncharacterized protein BKA55DRAFT_526370 [Fusarium redolens]|uniref:Uncharacterized protein n=1 Tax=Fusarium redolens TaxID=48865 RepID=A0A9P9G0S1_FUSRE|nr:uncharacterized protein BKA55DRAFT_526370 [Fusarium redolens]KAH7230133.1 hypothetical protein BKA55DRAFT_526370 [Fusarium redolens]